MTMSKGHILRAIMRRYGTCGYAILGVLEQLEVAGLIEGKTLKNFRQLRSMVNTEGEGGRGQNCRSSWVLRTVVIRTVELDM